MNQRFELFSMSLFNISRYWNKIASDAMKNYGLKGSYALYLVTMLNKDSVTSVRLCELCGKDKADVSRALSALEEKKLVVRTGATAYRAELTLTPEGQRVASSISMIVTEAVDLAGKGLSEEDRTSFYRSLEIISENLKKISREGIPQK